MTARPPPSDSRIDRCGGLTSSPLRYVNWTPARAVTSSNNGGPLGSGSDGLAGVTADSGFAAPLSQPAAATATAATSPTHTASPARYRFIGPSPRGASGCRSMRRDLRSAAGGLRPRVPEQAAVEGRVDRVTLPLVDRGQGPVGLLVPRVHLEGPLQPVGPLLLPSD